MLGADTRATEGPIVADKNCEKIHYIADNIFCCGASTLTLALTLTLLTHARCWHGRRHGEHDRCVRLLTPYIC